MQALYDRLESTEETAKAALNEFSERLEVLFKNSLELRRQDVCRPRYTYKKLDLVKSTDENWLQNYFESITQE